MGRYSQLIESESGLLAYWPLDGEYLLSERATNTYGGTAAGGVTIGTATGPGELTATDFDGVDDRVTTAFNPFTNGTVRTFEGWATRDTSGTADALIAGSAASNYPGLFLASGSNDVSFTPANGGTTSTWTAAWPGNGQWVHWMLVFDESADSATLYVNGISQGAKVNATAYNASPGNVTIGQQSTSTNPFDGKLCHLVVYNGDKSALAPIHYLQLASGPALPPSFRNPPRGTGAGPFQVTVVDPQNNTAYPLAAQISGLNFSNVNPGGDETCTFQLMSPWARALPQVTRGNIVRVTHGPDVLWQGRIADLDPTGDASEAIGVTAYGLGARLKDTTMQEIYVDSDFSAWQGMSVQRKINALTGGVFTNLADAVATTDSSTGAPSLETALIGAFTGTTSGRSEGWYDALGISIGSVYYGWKKTPTVDNADTNWSWAALASSDDIVTASDTTGSLRAAGPGSGTLTTTGTKPFAFVQLVYTGTGGVANKNYGIFWTSLAVYGTHGLAKGSGTPPGFTADQMVRDIIGRASGVVARRVDAQTFEIQQMEFRAPTAHEDAVAAIDELEGCDWGTWGTDNFFDTSTTGNFDYTTPDTTTQHWTCFRAETDACELHAEISSLYNRVQVNYTGVDGRTRIVTRTTSVPELDRIGATRTAVLDAGTSTQAGAQTLGDAFLALQGAYAPSRGTVTLSRPVRHYRRGPLPPYYIRANGSNIRIPDVLPAQQLFDLNASVDRRTTFPVKRVAIDASGAAPVVQVELDQTRDLLSILQARLGLEAKLLGL